MINSNKDKYKKADAYTRPFLCKVEEIRERRKTEQKKGTYFPLYQDSRRKFAQDEMKDYFGFVKNLFIGKGGTPPLVYVENLAEYLECNELEKNELFRSLGYRITGLIPKGDIYRELLNYGIHLINTDYANIPAYVIDKDWTILSYNSAVLKIFNISQQRVDKIPLLNRNVLDFILNPLLEMKEIFETPLATWREVAKRNIVGWKIENYAYAHEKWYSDFEDRMKSISTEVKILWEESTVDSVSTARPFFDTPFYRDECIVHIRSEFSHFGDYKYPHLTKFHLIPPIDEKIKSLWQQF